MAATVVINRLTATGPTLTAITGGNTVGRRLRTMRTRRKRPTRFRSPRRARNIPIGLSPSCRPPSLRPGPSTTSSGTPTELPVLVLA